MHGKGVVTRPHICSVPSPGYLEILKTCIGIKNGSVLFKQTEGLQHMSRKDEGLVPSIGVLQT
jgi:hypothetical protein